MDMNFPAASASLSPASSYEADSAWVNDFLCKSQPVTNPNMMYVNYPNTYSAYDSAVSQGSSSHTSGTNSPSYIKMENQELDLAGLDLRLQEKQLKSLESIFDTKDILIDESTSVSPAPNNFEASKKRKPKTRGPRKKLTDSQKQAHNKIEKKYRININGKIAGLQKIIPEVAFESIAFETGSCQNDGSGNCQRLNKSMILEKATEYILMMQEKERRMEDENKALKLEVMRLGGLYT